MSLEEELDITNEDPEQLDRGNQLNPGWYRAMLDNVTPDVEHPGTLVFTFQIVGGPFDGVKKQKRLFDPVNSRDTNSAKKLSQQRITWAKRLGLIDNTAAGQRVRIDWQAAVGQQAAIKVVNEKGQDGVVRPGIEWAGVFPLTDERVPAVIRGSTPTVPTPRQAPINREPPRPTVDYGTL